MIFFSVGVRRRRRGAIWKELALLDRCQNALQVCDIIPQNLLLRNQFLFYFKKKKKRLNSQQIFTSLGWNATYCTAQKCFDKGWQNVFVGLRVFRPAEGYISGSGVNTSVESSTLWIHWIVSTNTSFLK